MLLGTLLFTKLKISLQVKKDFVSPRHKVDLHIRRSLGVRNGRPS